MDTKPTDQDFDRLKRKLAREARAREEAERLLEQKSAELFQASEQARKLAQAIENIADGVCITDEDRKFIFLNASMTRMFGYEPEELLGKHWSILFDDQEYKGLRKKVIPILTEQGSWNGETIGKHKLGAAVIQEVTLTGLKQGSFICASRDISTRKRREQILKEMEKRLQDAERDAAVATFGQAIAHDLNNLIAVISGYSGILIDTASDQTAVDQLKRIKEASRQAEDVIQSLQLQTVDVRPVRELNLSNLIQTSLEIAEGLCPDYIKIEQDIESDIRVETDELLLSRCLLNIIKNSFEAISTQGGVLVKVRKSYFDKKTQFQNNTRIGYPSENVSATIEILDDGSGMDKEALEHAFIPFHTTKNERGKGLGMQSLKALTDEDLAYIEVGSSPDLGTCFRIHLLEPISFETTAQSQNINSDDPTIMLVDDDVLVGEMMETMLSHLGYACRFYSDQEEALATLKDNPVDIIISDYHMPNMNGEELARHAKAILPNIPVVIYSGQAASIKVNPLFEAILAKPVAADVMDRVLKDLIIEK